MDLPVQRRMLSVNDLLEADEVFMTNSSWLVLPVTRVEKKQIGAASEGGSNPQPGPITRRLREALLKQVGVVICRRNGKVIVRAGS